MANSRATNQDGRSSTFSSHPFGVRHRFVFQFGGMDFRYAHTPHETNSRELETRLRHKARLYRDAFAQGFGKGSQLGACDRCFHTPKLFHVSSSSSNLPPPSANSSLPHNLAEDECHRGCNQHTARRCQFRVKEVARAGRPRHFAHLHTCHPFSVTPVIPPSRSRPPPLQRVAGDAHLHRFGPRFFD